MRKVWYHQIWIQNYLGFIVSDLPNILLALAEWEPCSWKDTWQHVSISFGMTHWIMFGRTLCRILSQCNFQMEPRISLASGSYLHTYLIEFSGVSLNKWGCQNPPEPSLVVFGEKDSAIISSSASGKAFFNLTAEELPTIPAPTTQNFMLNRY